MKILPATRVLFLGNHNMGHDALRLMLDAGVNVVGVFAHPDSDDASNLWYRSTKRLAIHAGIPTYQPKSLKGEIATRLVKELAPELLISVSYSKIIPKSILAAPRLGAVNLHGSLLPEYRGRFCPVWAVMNGEKHSGATLHVIEEGIDTGDIIDQVKFQIHNTDTGYSVYMRMCAYGLDLLRRRLPDLLLGSYSRRPQPYLGRYFSSVADEDRRVDWNRPTDAVLNQIRACYFPPYPSSYTFCNGQRYPIWRAGVAYLNAVRRPGRVIGFDLADRPVVSTLDGAVVLLETELVHPYLTTNDILENEAGHELIPCPQKLREAC